MLKQFKSVYDQKKPTAMIQRNPKNQDFSLRKLKYFVIGFRKTERRIWWRDVIKMHYGKCSISECQLLLHLLVSSCMQASMFFYLFWPIALFSLLQISCHIRQRMCFGEISAVHPSCMHTEDSPERQTGKYMYILVINFWSNAFSRVCLWLKNRWGKGVFPRIIF